MSNERLLVNGTIPPLRIIRGTVCGVAGGNPMLPSFPLGRARRQPGRLEPLFVFPNLSLSLSFSIASHECYSRRDPVGVFRRLIRKNKPGLVVFHPRLVVYGFEVTFRLDDVGENKYTNIRHDITI